MKTLVTGGAGFLGQHVVHLLAEQGHSVRVLLKAGIANTPFNSGLIELVTGNLLDIDMIRKACEGIECIIHCAAALPDNADEDEIWQVNVNGTANLLEVAVEAGVQRFIFISTDSVYGDGNNIDTMETAPINPQYFYEGNYPRSKLEAEKLVMSRQQARQLQTVIFRPCLIYGPGNSPASNIFKHWASQNTHWLLGGGHARISMVHVEDAARGILLATSTPHAAGQCYNLGGPDYSKREILQAISENTGREKRLFTVRTTLLLAGLRILHPLCQLMNSTLAQKLDPARIQFSLNNHVINFNKAAVELGYKPRVELNAGMAATMDWIAINQGNDRNLA